MKRVPLQLKLASAFGILGGGIGSLIGAWLTLDFYGLVTGFLIGFTIGFVIGYRLGGMIKTVESVALAERFSSGVDILAIVLSLILVVAGLVALILYGWDVRVLLSTLFFLLCSLYLGCRRYKNGKGDGSIKR